MPTPTRDIEPLHETAPDEFDAPQESGSPLPPITHLRRADTHRLLPAKYSPDYESVLTRIADDDQHLEMIFELDNATNSRLQAEEGLVPGISTRELVFHVPHYRVINAAFTHPNPLGARFSTPSRGAWYAAFSLATAKAEVAFHKSVEYAEINWREREETQYDDYLADFSASFHDLRRVDSPPAHGDEDQATTASTLSSRFAEYLSATTYVASQQLAVELLLAGSLGIIYPSVRRPSGRCLACFRPSIVSNVRKHFRYKFTWAPAHATFTREGI